MDTLLLHPGTGAIQHYAPGEQKVNVIMHGLFKNGNFKGIKKIGPIYKNVYFFFFFFFNYELGFEMGSNVFLVYGGPRNPRTKAHIQYKFIIFTSVRLEALLLSYMLSLSLSPS